MDGHARCAVSAKQLNGLINIDGAGISNVLRFVRLTGGMPSMTGKDPAAHMLLIRDTMPDVYARTYKFLNVLDYINLRLTGEFVAQFRFDRDFVGHRQSQSRCASL